MWCNNGVTIYWFKASIEPKIPSGMQVLTFRYATFECTLLSLGAEVTVCMTTWWPLLFVMITHKMEQKTYELKKNIGQWFDAQSEMIKRVVHEVYALLIENFKAIFKEEVKK